MNRLVSTALCCAVVAAACGQATAQQPSPPPGYFDIPSGFDFPGDKQALDQARARADVPAQRRHVWNVFAGMTQRTPDGRFAIFETWFSEEEVFAVGPSPQASGPRRVVRRFRQPAQLGPDAPGALPQAAGTALLSEVLYTFAGYNHVRSNRLFLASELENLQQTGPADPTIPNNRDVPPFPAPSVALKTVWWPVAKDQVTAMPIWDPDSNPPRPNGNPFTTWARVVAVDPTRTNIPPNETATAFFLGKAFPNSHVVGLDAFHNVTLDDQTAANAMQNGRTARAAQIALGRGLQGGDHVVLVATHLTTKEIDDWVWATLWWHDRPNDGPFAADRTANVTGVWRNFLMSAAYDLNTPPQPDGTPHVAFNPWLEAPFPNGTKSNCMNCHNRATFPPVSFLPVRRGNPDLQNDPAYAPGRLRTDFLWSIPFSSQ
jgi:hypothetical protein